MPRILVTGSRGFIGQHLTARLLGAGHQLHLANRNREPAPGGCESFAVGDIGPGTDWKSALNGCDTVVHLAGESSNKHLDDVCTEVNDAGTLRLTQQAAAADVRNFVLLSSIAVMVGNASDEVVSDASPSAPINAYGRSKLAAEHHVRSFASPERYGVSLRAPLVYGRGAKGNWKRVEQLAATGLPLPFGAVRNRRTMISVGNLVDAIARVVDAASERSASSGSFVVADAESLSLTDILLLLRSGQPARLLPVPPAALRLPLALLGKATIADSLFGDLELDASRFCTTFNWTPPQSAREAVRDAAQGNSRVSL